MKKIIILIIPIIIFVFINISFVDNYTVDYRDTSVYYGRRSSNLDSKDYDYVNIGSSHGARGIIYPQNVNGINLAFSRQVLYYGIKLLESIDGKLSEDAVIIIPLDYGSFDGRYEGDISRYIPYIDYQLLKEDCSIEDYLVEKYFPLIGMNNMIDVVSATIENPYDLLYRTNDMDEWLEESRKTVEYHAEIANLSHEYLSILEDYLESQANNDRSIILINFPYHTTYNDNYNDLYPEILIDYYQVIEFLVEHYDVTYIDFSHWEFSDDIEYFYDDDHLNYNGAIKFTEELFSRIE